MRWSNHIKLGNKSIKKVIDAVLPNIKIAPMKIVRLRLWVSLLASFSLLSKQDIAACLSIIVILFLDGLDGSIARKNGVDIYELDAAADRFTELFISVCFLKFNLIAGIILLILSIVNGLKSPFFNRYVFPSFPVLQTSLVLLIVFIFT